jgi:DNA invertase Pin-like site-specific DNA recombinase
MSSTNTRRAVIYTRLSRSRSDEPSGSTVRQEAECRKLAEDRGYTVVAVETDDDVSAYSGRHRPGYTRVMDAVATGATDAVIAWAADRLHRAPRELEDFVEAVEAAGVEVLTVQAGSIDLSTPPGRMQARMLGAAARYESEHRSERTRLAHEAIAREGRWKGGRRPFGYTVEFTDPERRVGGSLVVDAAEAEVIREAAARVLGGERVGAVANDLQRRGVPTVRNSTWTTPTLRGILSSPTIAGRRTFRGEDVGPAAWEAIIDADTAAALKSHFDAGARRGRPARLALLSGGRCVCAACQVPMRTARRSNGIRTYRCAECYCMVTAEPFEELVTEALLRRLDAAELPTTRRPVAPAADLDALEADLEALAEDMGAGRITRAEWMAARGPLLERIDAARAAAVAAAGAAPLAGLTKKGAVRRAWPDLDLARRQAIMDVLIDAVVIARATRRGPGLDPGRVDIRWKA